MRSNTILGLVAAFCMSTSVFATTSIYQCASPIFPNGTLSIEIESGVENGVGNIVLTSSHANGKMGWAQGNNVGNKTYCQSARLGQNTFTLTEALGASSYAFEFPNPIFRAPVNGFGMYVIYDADSDGKSCSLQPMICKRR